MKTTTTTVLFISLKNELSVHLVTEPPAMLEFDNGKRLFKCTSGLGSTSTPIYEEVELLNPR